MRPAFLIELLVFIAVHGEARCDAAEIVLEPVGAIQWDHRSTLDPADDEYWFEVRIIGAGIPPASPGWSSDAIPGSGDYVAPDPVKFGPWRARHGELKFRTPTNGTQARSGADFLPPERHSRPTGCQRHRGECL